MYVFVKLRLCLMRYVCLCQVKIVSYEVCICLCQYPCWHHFCSLTFTPQSSSQKLFILFYVCYVCYLSIDFLQKELLSVIVRQICYSLPFSRYNNWIEMRSTLKMLSFYFMSYFDKSFFFNCLLHFLQAFLKHIYTPLPGGGGGYTVLPLSVCPSVRPRYFSSHFSQHLSMAEIWYLITSFIYVCHIVGSIFGPVRFLLPVCRLSWFIYTLNIYAHFSSHFSQQLLMTWIWYLVKSFILVPHIVGSVFGPIRFLLPVCRLCWFLYTLNIYAHISSHFSQQILMTRIWYLVTSFILVPHIVGRVFGPIRFLLPVCQLCWFLYTLNIYAHISSHFSRQILMAEIWYLVTSFI